MRRNTAPIREIFPDPKYGSVLVAKFINCIMLKGKKSVAEKIVYGAMDYLVEKMRHDDKSAGKDLALKDFALSLFSEAVGKVKPIVEVRSRRVGGATYQIPKPVAERRGLALAMRWLIDAAKKRSEKTMQIRLGAELLDALKGRGNAAKKCDDVAKMAKANQAFAHFS